MKKTIINLIYFLKLLLIIKLRIIGWIFANKGEHFKINIYGDEITIRKGTTDFRVALSTLKEFEILRYALKKDFRGVIIDAGGYIGTAAIALSKMFPEAKIISIEASKENFDLLQINCKNYRNIIPLNNALSSKPNETIFLNDRGTGHWGFTIVAIPADNIATKKYTVQTITIKGIEEQYGKVSLLKLDVEGAEKDLFENDESIREVDVIMVELHDRIAPGCTNAFFDFSKDRTVLKDSGEKFISIKLT